jgi:hypothetical protein
MKATERAIEELAHGVMSANLGCHHCALPIEEGEKRGATNTRRQTS